MTDGQFWGLFGVIFGSAWVIGAAIDRKDQHLSRIAELLADIKTGAK